MFFSGGNMIIREAVINDIENVCDLWEEMMEFHEKRNDYFALKNDAKEKYKEYLKICIKKRKNLVIVTEINNKIVAYLMAEKYNYPPVYVKKDYIEIVELAVNIGFRRIGIAGKLLKEVEKWAEKYHIKNLECKYSVSNEKSTSFWEGKGFEPVMKTGYFKL